MENDFRFDVAVLYDNATQKYRLSKYYENWVLNLSDEGIKELLNRLTEDIYSWWFVTNELNYDEDSEGYIIEEVGTDYV